MPLVTFADRTRPADFREKRGVLDGLDGGTYPGPAVQPGPDEALGSSAILNLDLRRHAFTADIESGGERLVEILVDPTVPGAGVGFRFQAAEKYRLSETGAGLRETATSAGRSIIGIAV